MTQQQTPPPPPGPPQPGPPPPPPPPAAGPAQLPKGQAVAAMVCGIISICVSCLPIAPLVLGILGIALGAIAIKKANQGIAGGKGMAVAGLVCGIVGTVWGAIYTIYWLVVGSLFFAAAREAAQQSAGTM